MASLKNMSSQVVPKDDLERKQDAMQPADAHAAVKAEHELSIKQALKTYRKAVLWCLVVCMSTIMESYDTLIIGSFYAYPTFQKKFGEKLPSGKYSITAEWQLGLSTGSSACLIIGGFLNGWLVEQFGPRRVMLVCHAVLIGLIFITFFAPNIKVLLVGEMLCSLPWGVFASLTPAYAAEVCPMALRSYLTTYVNFCWVMGHLIAAGVLRGLVSNSTQWSYRIPFALQWMWPPFLIIALWWMPESPWWQVRKNKIASAEATMARLYTHDPGSDSTEEENIKRSVALMSHTIETEKELNIGTTWAECFRGVNLRRTEIACISWGCQILPGFAIQNYITYFFTLAGVATTSSYKLSIGVYALAFLGTFLSWFLQGNMGRRTIYIGGLCAMAPLMFAVGFLELGSGSSSIRSAQSALLLIWFFAYGLTIGPLPYAIAAEVGASRLRVKTIALGRNTYYLFNILNAICTPYMLNPTKGNLKGKGAFPAAVCTLALLVWAYFRLPETKGRTYQELDVLFEKRVPARKFKNSVVDVYDGDAENISAQGQKERLTLE